MYKDASDMYVLVRFAEQISKERFDTLDWTTLPSSVLLTSIENVKWSHITSYQEIRLF